MATGGGRAASFSHAWAGRSTPGREIRTYFTIADPTDAMAVSMKIDPSTPSTGSGQAGSGQAAKPAEVTKAYSSVYPWGAKRTFVGFYADVSALKPDRRYKVELGLPELKAGQFQGLFFDNIEPEHTDKLR